MPMRKANLNDRDDQFVESQADAGRYQNASEVIRAGLRLLEQRSREGEEKLGVLRRWAAEAFDELDRGEAIVIEGEDALTGFIRRSDERAAGRAERRPECR